jgi:hypothetical protein
VESIIGEYDWSTSGIDEDGPVAPSTSGNFVSTTRIIKTAYISSCGRWNHGSNLYIETVRIVRNLKIFFKQVNYM